MHASTANSIDTGWSSICFFMKTTTREPSTLSERMLNGSFAGTSSGCKKDLKTSISRQRHYNSKETLACLSSNTDRDITQANMKQSVDSMHSTFIEKMGLHNAYISKTTIQ